MLVSFNPSVKINRNSNPGVLKKPESKNDPSFGLNLLSEIPPGIPKDFWAAEDIVYSLGHTLPINEANIKLIDHAYLNTTGIVQKYLTKAYKKLNKTPPAIPNP